MYMYMYLQVLDSSLQSVGEGEVDTMRAELESVRQELADRQRAVSIASEERDRLQQDLDAIKDQFNVSEVHCAC